ncbi:hypothetical protein [Deinococcus sp.]|uniref:hypothetical protein n=1 Tax=Deinococcus sp. TaxID=47478 RepID=UPI003C7AB085
MKSHVPWPLLIAPLMLCPVLVGCGAGSTAPVTSPGSGPAPAPVGGPPAGKYGCLLLTYTYPDGYPTPTYVPSALGTVMIGPGNGYSASSFPDSGTYTFDAAKSWITFRGGPLDRVNASFDRLKDGVPILRFGEGLADPAPDVSIGESVCQGGAERLPGTTTS